MIVKKALKMNSSVYLCETANIQSSIDDSVTRIMNTLNVYKKTDFDCINIKPNLCYYWKSSTGYTTDPRVVLSIVKYIRSKYEDIEINIVESDASGMRTKHAFTILDYRQFEKMRNVNLLNLSKEESRKYEIDINGKKIKFHMPKMLIEDNLLINVPKFKIMNETYLTCALKNIFGCISETRKINYHDKLAETIVAANQVVKSDIIVVDGIVALSKYPFNMNMLMGGENAFSIDWVASKIMKYNPNRIKFLNLAKSEKLGDPNKIVLNGDDIKSFYFPHVNNFLSKNTFKTLLKLLNIYSKIVGDVVPPMLENM